MTYDSLCSPRLRARMRKPARTACKGIVRSWEPAEVTFFDTRARFGICHSSGYFWYHFFVHRPRKWIFLVEAFVRAVKMRWPWQNGCGDCQMGAKIGEAGGEIE